MRRKITPLLLVLIGMVSSFSYGQQTYNLTTELQKERITEVNRDITSFTKYADAVEMDAREGDGLGILKEIEFETGTIEIDLLGENNPGKSFIGIAFNIEDKKTFEAIYFRPFNFVATEQARKDHMVQYVYHPEFTWYNLRENRTMEFENEIPEPPDPNQWFNAKIVVSEKEVKVFVDEIAEPVLVVERLTKSSSKKIGLWVGNGSSGRFRNLVLTQ
jgi:hypothetical protein